MSKYVISVTNTETNNVKYLDLIPDENLDVNYESFVGYEYKDSAEEVQQLIYNDISTVERVVSEFNTEERAACEHYGLNNRLIYKVKQL